MDILRRLFRMEKPKPYKIQDFERKIGRIGVTAFNLKDLRKKAAEKLSLGNDHNLRIVLEEDGTEITDQSFFETLPEQTAFVVLKQGQFWDGYITYLELANKKILENISPEMDLVKDINSLFNDPESAKMVAIMQYVKELDLNTNAEKIDEDPDWFVGISSNLKSKEDVLKRSAKDRVRNYLNTSKDYINNQKVKPAARKVLLAVLQEFRMALKEVNYFEEYFARSAKPGVRFCNKLGWFTCEGPFNKKSCKNVHRINPYGSRGWRILFKTWNLDHRIEKSREILPEMVKAAEDCPEDKEINTSYFYDLLFTRKNLKLVDVRCHDISAHTGYKVDRTRIHRKRKLK